MPRRAHHDAPPADTEAAASHHVPLEKACAVCGRTMVWRKAWARSWAQQKTCSARCRAHKLDDVDARLEAEILARLRARARGATICPSEVARAVFDADSWRGQMERTRQAARRLVQRGTLDIVQQGAVVDGDRARGPIRLRLRT